MAEHSKLPWVANFYTHQNKPSHFWIQTKEVEGTSFVVAKVTCYDMPELADANANFIVTACNEYDLLKTKSKMLDEFIECISDTVNPNSYTARFVDIVKDLDK